MAGFGRNPFGKGPFGRSDTGRDLVVELFPDEYFDDSIILDAGEALKDNDKDPILQILKTYANSIHKRRVEIEGLADLLDPEKAPLDIVRLFGDTLGLGIDKNDPEFIQRSFLNTASQWLQIKASTRGYEVRGLASGFNVRVDNFWRIDPVYSPLIPLRFQYQMRPAGADNDAPLLLHTDKPPGSYPGTPTQEDRTYAKSSYVRVVFSVSKYKDHVDYNKLLDLVILKIRDVVGIHHELTAPQFLVDIQVAAQTSSDSLIHESIDVFNFNESYFFDIVAADEVPLDQDTITVAITLQDSEREPVDAVPVPTLEIQENTPAGLDASAITASMTVGQDQNLPINAAPSLAMEFSESGSTNAAVGASASMESREEVRTSAMVDPSADLTEFVMEYDVIVETTAAILQISENEIPSISAVPTVSIKIQEAEPQGVSAVPSISMRAGELSQASAVQALGTSSTSAETTKPSVSATPAISVAKIQESYVTPVTINAGVTVALNPKEGDFAATIELAQQFDATPADTITPDSTLVVIDNIVAA